MVKTTREQREFLANVGDILVELPMPPAKYDDWGDKMNRYLMDRYHFEIDMDPESDYEGDVFYNADLRSIMGHLDDPYGDLGLVLSGRFFAGSNPYPDYRWEYDNNWGETYWKRVLDDALTVHTMDDRGRWVLFTSKKEPVQKAVARDGRVSVKRHPRRSK